MAAFAAPFIYRDGTHAMMATDPANSEIMKEMSEKLVKQANIRIVGRLYRGARQMTAKMAVYSPADLKDKRFRGVPLQLWTTMIKGMGAVPTPVEVAELPTAQSTRSQVMPPASVTTALFETVSVLPILNTT